jgi:hypothetical protein
MVNLVQRHPFHLVDQSPWPFLAGMSSLSVTTGFVMYMHCYQGGFLVFGFGFFLGIVGSIFASISFKKCRPRGPYKGRGMAISGLICSIISVVLWTVFISIMTGA